MPRGAAWRRRLYLGGNDRLSKHRRGIDQSPGWDLGSRHRAQPGRRRRDRHAKYDGKRAYRAIVIARPDLEIKKWPENGRGLRISFAISSARFLRAVLNVPARLHALSNLAMVRAAATPAALFPSLVPTIAILIGVPLIGRYLTQSSWPGCLS